MNNKIKKLFSKNETYIFLILVALSILIEFRSGQFFTLNNIVDIMSAMIVPGLFAVGAFLVILTGGFDVSFPALASLVAYATTKLLLETGYTGSVIVPFIIAIALGLVFGAINGFFVGYLDFPAMIVTLGTSSIFKGIMQGTLQSKQLAVIPKAMKDFGTSGLVTVTNPTSGLSSRLPVAFLILVLVYLVFGFILKYTMFGRGIYAIGGNPQAAHTVGFKVKRTKFLLFVIVGAISSIAGIIRVCLMQQCHPTNMLGMEMNIIAGVVLGGTSVLGGKGSLTGCFLGTLLIVLVENSMILIGVPVIWKDVFVGLLIIIGTAISAIQSNKQGRRKVAKKGKEN